MRNKLTLKKTINRTELEKMLRTVEFRGLYDKNGNLLRPYKDANFSLVTVYPQKHMGVSPKISLGKNQWRPLFSPQPTIYQNQTHIMMTVDKFLQKKDIKINKLKFAIEYDWEGRGSFHMLPPVVEKHMYNLREGFFDLDKLANRFKNTYVKDAMGNLHHLKDRFLNSFFIDEVSNINHLDIFHSNAPLINYGVQYNGLHEFYIICDGSHRIDYSIEILNEPISVLVVEPNSTPLIPYYAFPVSFRPTIRLSSKRSEKMYPRLERDKIHLFNDFIKKVLHYDWSKSGLNVGSLRSKTEIY